MTTAETAAVSTATVFGRPVLPAAAAGHVPFWRVALRGCSQCCFQTNEITGVLFLLAVLAYDVQQFGLFVMGALIGTVVAKVLRADTVLLELGLYGFNSCLMALAIGNFFHHDAAMWVAAAVLCAVATVLAWALMKLVRFPVLAAPFILTFWVFWPISEHVGLTKLVFPPFIDTDVFWLRASIAALGATLFAGIVAAGILFFVGLLISNWRHAVLAVAAAFLAHAIAVWWNVPGEQINAGLAGFNAVLAVVAIYALAQADVRVALFGAVVASAILPAFSRLDLVPLAAGFVTTTWLVLVLGWVQRRWFQPADAGGNAAVP